MDCLKVLSNFFDAFGIIIPFINISEYFFALKHEIKSMCFTEIITEVIKWDKTKDFRNFNNKRNYRSGHFQRF